LAPPHSVRAFSLSAPRRSWLLTATAGKSVTINFCNLTAATLVVTTASLVTALFSLFWVPLSFDQELPVVINPNGSIVINGVTIAT
jgi:hypothetical protein